LNYFNQLLFNIDGNSSMVFKFLCIETKWFAFIEILSILRNKSNLKTFYCYLERFLNSDDWIDFHEDNSNRFFNGTLNVSWKNICIKTKTAKKALRSKFTHKLSVILNIYQRDSSVSKIRRFKKVSLKECLNKNSMNIIHCFHERNWTWK
jgi:hypothetical protein